MMDEGNDGNTGQGFTIECKGGETFLVCDKEASNICKRSMYFQNVFKHGTRESVDRVLRKPDWSLILTKQVIEYLTPGKRVVIPFDDRPTLLQFLGALEQILIPALPLYPVFFPRQLRYMPIPMELGPRILDLTNHENQFQFSVTMNLCGEDWDEAIRNDILFLPLDCKSGNVLPFEIPPTRSLDEDQLWQMKHERVGKKTFQVRTPLPLVNAIYHITRIMQPSYRKMFSYSLHCGDILSFITVPFAFPRKTLIKTRDGEVGTIGGIVEKIIRATGTLFSSRDFHSGGGNKSNKIYFQGTLPCLKECLTLLRDELCTATVYKLFKFRTSCDEVIPRTETVCLGVSGTNDSENLHKQLLSSLIRMNEQKLEVFFTTKTYIVNKDTDTMMELLTLATSPLPVSISAPPATFVLEGKS